MAGKCFRSFSVLLLGILCVAPAWAAPIAVPDANLEQALEEAMGLTVTIDGAIDDANFAGFTEFEARSKGIADLTGLEAATDLTSLKLRDNDIVSLTPLAGLTSLNTLDLGSNAITDLSPLSGLTALTYLEIGFGNPFEEDTQDGPDPFAVTNLITDLAPLATLVNLEYLNTVGNQGVTSIAVVSSLTSLANLWIGGGPIADFTPLATRADSLSFLAIVATNTLANSDMATVNTLTNLSGFALLAEPNLTDISALTDLNPQVFVAYFTALTGISVFANYTNLNQVILGGNPMTSLDGLEAATNLQVAQLEQNALTDIDALSGLTALTELQLGQNNIADISALSTLTGIESLRLDDNQITSLQPLIDNTGLGGNDNVSIRNNPLSETAICDELPLLRAKFNNEFNVEGDYFCGPTFNLTINIVGVGETFPSAGVVPIGQGETVFINATPTAGSGYAYNQMTGAINTTDNFGQIVMDSDKSVTVEFINTGTLRTLTIQSTGAGNGNVGPGIGQFSYIDGRTANLFANTNNGGYFGGWSGDLVSVIPNEQLLMDADKNVTVAFANSGYQLDVAANGFGFISPPVGTYQLAEGLVVPVVATPGVGNTFLNWTGEVDDPDAASTTVTMDGPRSITATFISGDTPLTITTLGGGTTNPAPGTTFFPQDTPTTVNAIPGPGQAFDRWTGDIGDADPFNPSLNLIMSEARSVQAEFVTADFNLVIQVSGDGSTNPPAGSYGYLTGQVALVSAVNSGSDAFSEWTGDIDVASPTSSTISLTMDQDRTITANFIGVDFFLTITAPNGSGTTTPAAGSYGYVDGALATALARPTPGSRFVGWQGDYDGTLAVATVFMDQNKSITPIFEAFDEQPIVFNDANLEAAARLILNKPTGDIFPSDAVTAGQLPFGNANISDLTGLHFFNQASRFNGFNNGFSDISEVAGLTGIDASDIASNNVEDITPYNGLPFLRELNFGANLVSDLSGLDTLPNLEKITAFENNITDISTFANFKKLREINLNSNSVTDLSPLENLLQLTSIRMQNNDIQSLAPLANLVALSVIDFSGSSAISDLSPLANLDSLTQIELSRCNISDISVLEFLPNLEQVSLTNNLVTDLTPLVNNLAFATGDFLYIGNNPLTPEAACNQVNALATRGVTVIGAFCDNNPPVITLLGDPVVDILEGDTYIDAGATAFDSEDGTRTTFIVVTNPVDTGVPGTYTVRYNVQDSSGNSATEVTRTVNVISGDINPTAIDLQTLVPGFNAADGDNSGGLSLQELQAVLPGATQNDLDGIDVNGDGEIQLAELISGSTNGEIYTADQDGDNVVSLSELLRVIQFYNVGGYHCELGTEDGYGPGAGDQNCLRYAADLNVDFIISLSELLRVIQFYNIGGYNFCPDQLTEDGYCVGL